MRTGKYYFTKKHTHKYIRDNIEQINYCDWQVNNDIRDLERKLSLLRKAIIEKDLPLKVAQTRLDERTRRMNLELTHDEPMQGSVCHCLYTTTLCPQKTAPLLFFQ